MKSHGVDRTRVGDILQQTATAVYSPDPGRTISWRCGYDGLTGPANRYLPNPISVAQVLPLKDAVHRGILETWYDFASLGPELVRGFDLLGSRAAETWFKDTTLYSDRYNLTWWEDKSKSWKKISLCEQ